MDDSTTRNKDEPVAPSATRSAPANGAVRNTDKGQPDAPIDTGLPDVETGGYTMKRPPIAPNADEYPLDDEDPNEYPDYDLPDQPEGKRAPTYTSDTSD